MREIVRNFRSERTHLADVPSTTLASVFGRPYRKPPEDTEALCGARIYDGVVMREGTKLRCPSCRAVETALLKRGLEA